MKSTLAHFLTGTHHSSYSHQEGTRPRAAATNPHLSRSLENHDIHTEFLDAGIGCCWFAQQGDSEPVSGNTEDDALSRLAGQNGFQWREA